MPSHYGRSNQAMRRRASNVRRRRPASGPTLRGRARRRTTRAGQVPGLGRKRPTSRSVVGGRRGARRFGRANGPHHSVGGFGMQRRAQSVNPGSSQIKNVVNVDQQPNPVGRRSHVTNVDGNAGKGGNRGTGF